MAVSLEETQVDFATTPVGGSAAPWWEKPLLLTVLGFAAALMLAWLMFLGWVASLVASAIWP